MAVDPNRQTLIQQLGEMRNTRMQQMRVGNQQTQMMGRQVQLTQSMSAALQNNSRQLSTLNTTMSSGFRNLSSSFASSMRGLTSAVSRGAVGAASAAGGAAVGVGRVSASAMSGVTSGVVSALSAALPIAIAGAIGKTMVWDNIDDSTKKEMGENIGGIFKNVFGDSLKPVTKELKVMTMTLADTLESLSDRISGVVSGLKGKMPSVSQGTKDKVTGVTSSVKETAGNVASKVKQGVSAANKMGPHVRQQAEATAQTATTVGNVVKEGVENIPEPGKNVVVLAGATAVVAGGAKLIMKLQKDAKSYKLAKPTSVRSVMTAHLHNRVLPAMKGPAKAKYMKAFSLGALAGKVVPIASIIITLIGIEQAKNEINWLINNSDGQITKEDGDAFIAEATEEKLWGLAGGVAGGILGGLVGAGWLSAATAALGSYFGKAFTEWLHAMVSKGSTKLERDTSSLNVSVSSDVNKHAEKIGVTVDGKPYLTPAGAMKAAKAESKPGASAVSKPPASLADALAAQESGGAGYDAVYGSSTLESVEEYKKKTGKKVSQMTIEEAIAFGKSRGKNKGALGRYQFMPSTISDDLLKEAGLTRDDPFNAANQDKLFAVYTKRNADALKKLGISPTAANLQLAHVAGPKGAAKLLGAEEGKTAGDVLGYKVDSAARKTNPWMNKPAGEAVALLTRKSANIQPLDTEDAGGVSDRPQGSEDVAIAMPTDQVSAAQKPTAGMTTKQKMDYYREQLDGEDTGKAAKGKDASQKPSGPFSGFASLIGGGSFESMKNDLLAGLDSDMGRKAETTQAAPVIINNNGGDTNVTSSGGGGSSSPAYNPIAPAASYQSQFTSIAGIQRTA